MSTYDRIEADRQKRWEQTKSPAPGQRWQIAYTAALDALNAIMAAPEQGHEDACPEDYARAQYALDCAARLAVAVTWFAPETAA